MPKPLLLNRPSGLYVRFFVPKDLQPRVGTKYLVRSLQGVRADAARLMAAAFGYALRDPDKWVQTDFVRGQKNRALIFSAPLFHSRLPVGGIGTDATDARMVWVSHFSKLAPNGDFA